MLSGEKPFKGETTGEIMYEIINIEPESILLKNPDLPKELNSFIFQMISKEPKKRPDIITLHNFFNSLS